MADVPEDFNIWEGVYESFDEVPETGEGFDSDRWVEQQRTELQELRDGLERPPTVPPEPWYPFSQLPLLAAQLQRTTDTVRILDVGGGIGVTYQRLRACLEHPDQLAFHIMERGPVAEAGKETFADDDTVRYHDTIPAEPATFEIIHLGSSLQYIEEWRKFIERLCERDPDYLFFADLMAGDIPTYVTGQNYYGSVIPTRYYNFETIREHLSELGYTLHYRSQSKREILDELGPLPMENLPPENQLEHAMNALFVPA